MPCYFPLQASFSPRSDGKKDIVFSNAKAGLFQSGAKSPFVESSLSIPCGRCMGCRLERSRQWAVRCVHEASMYEENCFVTLTFDPEHLARMCPTGSLDRSHVQNFLKRLRQKFDDRKIRVFYCGEYGDQLGRPHYHVILFNLDFPDREFWKPVGDFKYYTSKVLSEIWPFGMSVIGDFSFETAAYVARYCTKKITGDMAESHYNGRLPEFAQPSLKPGIGRGWYDKYGLSDIFPRDECVSRGVVCKPPRYYDKILEGRDPALFEQIKEKRRLAGEAKEDDNSSKRLAVKMKCLEARMKCLVRKLEVSRD